MKVGDEVRRTAKYVEILPSGIGLFPGHIYTIQLMAHHKAGDEVKLISKDGAKGWIKLKKLTEEFGLVGTESKGKDQVIAPEHYANRKYQTILVMEDTLSPEQFKGYLRGNVIKYISRAGKKDSVVQELNKAKTYLQWLIEMESEGKLVDVPEFKAK